MKGTVNFGSNTYHKPYTTADSVKEWMGLPKSTPAFAIHGSTLELVHSNSPRGKSIIKKSDLMRDVRYIPDKSMKVGVNRN